MNENNFRAMSNVQEGCHNTYNKLIMEDMIKGGGRPLRTVSVSKKSTYIPYLGTFGGVRCFLGGLCKECSVVDETQDMHNRGYGGC